ncbi:MAG TPA: DNA polymerase III subunit gamma/tau [Pirellulales bacterium]|nr:DNA polymerase III subunit gamma/tau [Pirellulales bacterium]
METSTPDTTELESDRAGEYVVVARRYRPQTFAELVGQQHVAQALAAAIASNRVGHAYLFTGARGVGKTSSARILAKALNCVTGPTATPCNECDICRSISTGDDVDVMEIDGASNRGIDEMRQLRQNVNVRPSRARFKIYIIDEVHMLTKEAFNALLKTLEEPPEHVKFIFCTTEPEKIPDTIRSRCQRFDFAGIQTKSIAERLQQIVEAEGGEAEPAALETIARRAAGSMRDSQSLLEQLLAFGGRKLTLDDVHKMLGTAGDRRLVSLAGHLVARDAAAALSDLDRALAEGVDVGPLVDQLLGYFRDVMVAAAGGPAELMLYSSPSDQEAVAAAGRQLGLETVLAIMQILDQTLARLRYSTHGRILAELALLRICRLENLESISSLIGQLRDGLPASAAGEARAAGRPAVTPPPSLAAEAKKKPLAESLSEPSGSSSVKTASPRAESEDGLPRPSTVSAEGPGSPSSGDGLGSPSSASLSGPPPSPVLSEPASVAMGDDPTSEPIASAAYATADAGEIWSQVLIELGDMLAEMARFASQVAIPAPNRLVASFPEKYTSCKTYCERPDNVAKLEQALARRTGGRMRVEFGLLPAGSDSTEAKPAPRAVTPQQRLLEKAEHPLVRRAVELFGGFPVKVEEPDRSRV